jgi:anti-sigma factor RsiW
MTCVELVELVTDYLEGGLGRRDRVRFERHVATCDACSAYIAQIERTRSALGSLTENSIPPPAREALLEAFRDWRAA